jgi:hypothetical protein
MTTGNEPLKKPTNQHSIILYTTITIKMFLTSIDYWLSQLHARFGVCVPMSVLFLLFVASLRINKGSFRTRRTKFYHFMMENAHMTPPRSVPYP